MRSVCQIRSYEPQPLAPSVLQAGIHQALLLEGELRGRSRFAVGTVPGGAPRGGTDMVRLSVLKVGEKF